MNFGSAETVISITPVRSGNAGRDIGPINPARLHLVAGPHRVTLKSMLITETGRLTTP